jgi:tRNA1(Val) A37 N6-methylase TrmN6
MPMPTPISPDSPRGDVTRDRLLGGRVILVQPARGNRAAIDPVFLAAAVPARPSEHVLELGCGTGAAALCLAARVPGCKVEGIDVQEDLVALAQAGAKESGLSETVRFDVGDVLDLAAGGFDHVMANPPYQPAGRGRVSPDRARALANVEGAADLRAWVRRALASVNVGGTVTVIHRFDRGGEVASLLAASGADAVLFPLYPRREAQPNRVLIQGRLGGGGHIRSGRGLILHESDGRYTNEAEAVLRDGHALSISPS